MCSAKHVRLGDHPVETITRLGAEVTVTVYSGHTIAAERLYSTRPSRIRSTLLGQCDRISANIAGSIRRSSSA